MKILLVEDDALTRIALTQTLRDHHYDVDVATDGETGLNLAQVYKYDLLVLDVVLPGLDGISLCQQLRSLEFQNPIVLLTAKDSTTDQIIGLDAGADDYIIKPVDLEALMARMRALLRRKHSLSSSILSWENLQVNLNNCEIICQDKPIHLTAKEYSLLELFLLNPQRIFSRTVILERLWDLADSPGEETVSTHIKCLRQKLKAAGVADPIETVYGLGYRLRKPSDSFQSPQNSSKPTEPNLQDSSRKQVSQQSLQTQQKQVLNLTSKVWKKFKGIYSQQLAIVEQAVKALIEDNLTLELRQQASREAHKLAGSIGMFGLMKCSQLARKIEYVLDSNRPLEDNQKPQILDWLHLLKQEIKEASTHSVVSSNLPGQIPLILIIDDDLALAERIRLEALAWNLRVEIATDLIVAQEIIAQTPPDIILLDLNFESSTEDGFIFLENLSRTRPTLPVAVFTGRESLDDRVKVARLGASAFLHKPLPAHEILKTLTNLLNQNVPSSKNRVMVVDDDVLTLTTLVDLLTPRGIEVIPLTNPNQFWQVLTANCPDLLILDLEMPKFNGLDLCQVVRHDPKWQNLPVLFLSIHTEEKLIQQMFSSGADDYICKSYNPTELVNRILRRLKPKQWIMDN